MISNKNKYLFEKYEDELRSRIPQLVAESFFGRVIRAAIPAIKVASTGIAKTMAEPITDYAREISSRTTYDHLMRMRDIENRILVPFYSKHVHPEYQRITSEVPDEHPDVLYGRPQRLIPSGKKTKDGKPKMIKNAQFESETRMHERRIKDWEELQRVKEGIHGINQLFPREGSLHRQLYGTFVRGSGLDHHKFVGGLYDKHKNFIPKI